MDELLLETVFNYKRLKDRIESRKDSDAERQKSLKNLKSIAADYSESYIKGFEKILDFSLDKLYDGINLNDNGVDLAELLKSNAVVLVPNHQSHADYLAINYVVFKKYGFPMYIAGGINLNIFPIGKLFRKSGCFFIRRSFQNDVNYKFTLEAYLYYLLKTGKPIEFFFEGGRSRSGKLLPPRYGLYHMLIDAHKQILDEEPEKKLLFLPVSILHEYVPEQKALAKEMGGGKKKRENTKQLFSLFKLFAYQFGNVHIRFGKPLEFHLENEENQKKEVQSLAFRCFREVGRNMMVTPTSLLALVLLDVPQGALNWKDILSKSKAIVNFCEKFEIPFVDSLLGDQFEPTLERTIDILIGNKKIDVIGRNDSSKVFYSIKDECRLELLYFKNTILHHFLVPWGINSAWVNIFNGSITNVEELKEFFVSERDHLKHEFYLPTINQFFAKTLKIVSDSVGRPVTNLQECLDFSHKDFFQVTSKVGVFSRILSYIGEGYYCSGLAILALGKLYPDGFKNDHYIKKFKEVFDSEIKLGRVIKYQESFSIPSTKTSFRYFDHLGFLEFSEGRYRLADAEALDKKVAHIERTLLDSLSLNVSARG